MAEELYNKQIRLFTDDFKYATHLSVFNGWVDIPVFESQAKAAPVVKVGLSHTQAVQLMAIIKKIVADPEAQPIELGSSPWNKDLKVNEFMCSIKVGRDQEKCIYFDLSSAKHKEPIRFYLVTDRSIRINGMELPKQTLTEIGANAIIELLKILMTYAVKIQPGGRSFDNGGTYTPPSPTPSNLGQDVPF